jgi:hypothetical protein
MQDADVWAVRARKNRRLAAGLFAVSFLVLALMVAAVMIVRSGLPERLIDLIAGSPW